MTPEEKTIVDIKSSVTKSVEPFLIGASTLFFIFFIPWPLNYKSYIIIMIGLMIVPVNAFFASKNRNIANFSSRSDIFDLIRWVINFSLDVCIVHLVVIPPNVMTILWIALTSGAVVDITKTKYKILVSVISCSLFFSYIHFHFQFSKDLLYCDLVFLLYVIFMIMTSTNWHETLRKNYNIRENLEIEIVKKSREIADKEKMATIGLLASGVAHQLGNTINTISAGITSFKMSLKKGTLTPELVAKIIPTIQKAIDLSADIIHGLDFATKKNIKSESCSLKEIVDTSIVLMKGKLLENIQIKSTIDVNLNVFASQSSLLQVFMNLISNSIDAFANKSNGSIVISAKIKDENFVEVIFQDNAGGINELVIEKIFDAYVTTKNADKGSGIGLYVVKEELKANQGDIYVENIENGARFTLILRR